MVQNPNTVVDCLYFMANEAIGLQQRPSIKRSNLNRSVLKHSRSCLIVRNNLFLFTSKMKNILDTTAMDHNLTPIANTRNWFAISLKIQELFC